MLSCGQAKTLQPSNPACAAPAPLRFNAQLIKSHAYEVVGLLDKQPLSDIISSCQLLFRNRTFELRSRGQFKHLRIAVNALKHLKAELCVLLSGNFQANYHLLYKSAYIYDLLEKATHNALRANYHAQLTLQAELDSQLAGLHPISAELHYSCLRLEHNVRELCVLIQQVKVVDWDRYTAHLQRVGRCNTPSNVRPQYVLFNDLCGSVDVCYYMGLLTQNVVKAESIGVRFGQNYQTIKNESIVQLKKSLSDW